MVKKHVTNSERDSNYPKNTEAWKGRLKRFLVDPYAVELAKNGTNII